MTVASLPDVTVTIAPEHAGRIAWELKCRVTHPFSVGSTLSVVAPEDLTREMVRAEIAEVEMLIGILDGIGWGASGGTVTAPVEYVRQLVEALFDWTDYYANAEVENATILANVTAGLALAEQVPPADPPRDEG